MRFLIGFAAFLATGTTFAGNYADIVERAFAPLDNDYHLAWAFTATAEEDDVTFVGRYDPRQPEDERWTLLSVDGHAPTAEELEDYLDDRQDEFRRDDDGGSRDRIEMVDFSTLELVEETDDYWIFRFVPNGDDDEDEEALEFMRQVEATLKVVRDGHFLEYIDLRNNQPFRPAFGVKISRFLTRLTFGPAASDGPVVPLTIDVVVKGRAMLVIKFDETELTRFTDYEYVGHQRDER